MNTDEAIAACEATVRRFDPDRYFASLFAPVAERRLLFALYAFHHEIGRVHEAAREPMLAEIRLQWWRESLETAKEGRPRAHPAVIGLAELFARTAISHDALLALIDAQSPESRDEFATPEAHVQAASAGLMRIAAEILSAGGTVDEAIHAAGTARGLVECLRSLPRAAQEAGKIADAAKQHFAIARRARFRAALPAVMPAALVPLYLKVIKGGGDPRHVPLFRRQAVFLRSALTGRI